MTNIEEYIDRFKLPEDKDEYEQTLEVLKEYKIKYTGYTDYSTKSDIIVETLHYYLEDDNPLHVLVKLSLPTRT